MKGEAAPEKEAAVAAAVEEKAQAAAVTEEHQAAVEVAKAAPEMDGSMWINTCEGGCGDSIKERDFDRK